MSTAQGGGGLTLEVRVGEATFENGVFSGIEAGSPVYQQAANLQEGQCVIVSGTVESAASVLERSKVCDLDYYVAWSSVAGRAH